MKCSLSVIIPVYNRAHIISQAIESVLAQELKDIEILVIDDGSTDDSVEIVENYTKKYNNISLYIGEHNGPGAARNIGLQHAEGEYVAFLDSDDWIPPKAYHLMYKEAKEKDADVIIAQYLRKVNGGKWTPSLAVKELLNQYKDENCAGNFTIPVTNPSCCNKMIRRALLEQHQIRFPAAKMAEDLVFSVTVFEHASSAYMLDEAVYMYETNTTAASLVSTPDPEVIGTGFRMLKDLGMKFHSVGQVEAQTLQLEHSFLYILERFRQLPAGEDKNRVFEDIKAYLSLYQGYKEYRILIENMMGMDLDTLLTLPYNIYVKQRKLLHPAAPAVQKVAPPSKPNALAADAPRTVLQMYANGQIGIRFVFKCIKEWLKYKFKRHK